MEAKIIRNGYSQTFTNGVGGPLTPHYELIADGIIRARHMTPAFAAWLIEASFVLAQAGEAIPLGENRAWLMADLSAICKRRLVIRIERKPGPEMFEAITGETDEVLVSGMAPGFAAWLAEVVETLDAERLAVDETVWLESLPESGDELALVLPIEPVEMAPARDERKNRLADDILRQLAPHAILVGSAARSDVYNDIDLLVNKNGLDLARKLFPKGWSSAFMGNLKTFDTAPPIEVFVHWYGPSYAALMRRKTELVARKIGGVKLRAWPTETKPKSVAREDRL